MAMKAAARALLIIILCSPGAAACAETQAKPNIIIILADDMGYGDLGVYGASRIRTPQIDALARGGVIMTNGYASANVCSPSRAGLLTGRYAIRSGLGWKVIGAIDDRSLPATEETIAELVQRAGYQTAMVGKWHLGSFPENMPLDHGFNYFYGVPHSNDMPGFALYEGRGEIENPASQSTLTQRYTQAAKAFIRDNSSHPFLLYLAHTFPHIPLYPSVRFAGKSLAGAYGDVIEEIDWSTGEIVAELRNHGLLHNTLLIFTSDNGPFFEGSTGGLKGAKGNTWEGGYRVPFIVNWPAVIEAGGHSDALAVNIDLLPTLADILDLKPRAKLIDGVSLLPLWRGQARALERTFLYFNNETVVGVRDANWKYLTHSYYTASVGAFEKFDQLAGFNSSYDLLYNANDADGEAYSVAASHPDVLRRMQAELATARNEFEPLRTRPAESTYPR